MRSSDGRRLLFAVLPLCLMAGCVYVPTPEHASSESGDFRALVSGKDPKGQLRVGQTTVKEVEDWLGPPYEKSERDHVLEYKYGAVKGYTISPLTHFNSTAFRTYRLFMRFDDRAILSDYLVLREPYFDNNSTDSEQALRAFDARGGPP